MGIKGVGIITVFIFMTFHSFGEESLGIISHKNVIYRCSKNMLCREVARFPKSTSVKPCTEDWISIVERDNVKLKNLLTMNEFRYSTPIGLNLSSHSCLAHENKLKILFGNFSGFVHIVEFDLLSQRFNTVIMQVSQKPIIFSNWVSEQNFIFCSSDAYWSIVNTTKGGIIEAGEAWGLVNKPKKRSFKFQTLKDLKSCSYNQGVICGLDSSGRYECVELAGIKEVTKGRLEHPVESIINLKNRVFFTQDGEILSHFKSGILTELFSKSESRLTLIKDGKCSFL